MEWTGLEWSGVEWTGVDWTGLDWSGVDLSGVEWTPVHINICTWLYFVKSPVESIWTLGGTAKYCYNRQPVKRAIAMIQR